MRRSTVVLEVGGLKAGQISGANSLWLSIMLHLLLPLAPPHCAPRIQTVLVLELVDLFAAGDWRDLDR